MMMTLYRFALGTLLLLVFSTQRKAHGYPFRPVGQTLLGSPPVDGRDPSASLFRFGHSVKLSDDGQRMLVGAASPEGGAVFLYQLEDAASTGSSSSSSSNNNNSNNNNGNASTQDYLSLIHI